MIIYKLKIPLIVNFQLSIINYWKQSGIARLAQR